MDFDRVRTGGSHGASRPRWRPRRRCAWPGPFWARSTGGLSSSWSSSATASKRLRPPRRAGTSRKAPSQSRAPPGRGRLTGAWRTRRGTGCAIRSGPMARRRAPDGRCAASAVPRFRLKESIWWRGIWCECEYEFRVRIRRRLGCRVGPWLDASVVSGLESVARSAEGQNRFRSHQPRAPSQSAWAAPAETTYAMTPSGNCCWCSASIGGAAAAAKSMSAAI
jgi:hypothetical protein